MSYQPKTGAACTCRRGQQRDNCSNCEGTGQVIDFAAIRARHVEPARPKRDPYTMHDRSMRALRRLQLLAHGAPLADRVWNQIRNADRARRYWFERGYTFTSLSTARHARAAGR